MHNRVEDSAVEAVDLFVDLCPLDAERLSVGDQLIGQFVDQMTSALVVSGTLLASH